MTGGCSIIALASTAAAAATVCTTDFLTNDVHCVTTDVDDDVDVLADSGSATVDLADGFAGQDTVSIASVENLVLTSGDATITTIADGHSGLILRTGTGTIDAAVSSVTTSGIDADAVLVESDGDLVLAIADEVVTLGDLSAGLNLTAASIDATVGTITTTRTARSCRPHPARPR